MQLLWVPTYCGGRLLVGLYDSKSEWTAEMYKDATRFQNHLNGSPNYSDQLERYSRSGLEDRDRQAFNRQKIVVPMKLEDMAYLLRSYLHNMNNAVGTITAVTNGSQQSVGNKLKALGFIEAAKTEKYEGYGYCITWVGDVHKKVLPTIKKLIPDNYKPVVLGGEPVKKKKSLFAAFSDEDR